MVDILKFIDRQFKGQTHYVFQPDQITEMHDWDDGCRFSYAGGVGSIANVSARQFKRSLQDQLDEPLGFLKTDYAHGVRYINVKHILSVISRKPYTDGAGTHHTCDVNIDEDTSYRFAGAAKDVAYQVRRVLKRLDQDEEICCLPEEEEAEAEE